MHRTATKPTPLDFFGPTLGDDCRGGTHISYVLTQPDIGVYTKAPIRDGLRTPPVDEMGTKYHHPQYNGYVGRQEQQYSTPASANSYNAGYPGMAGDGRYGSTSHTSVPVTRNDISNHLPYVPARSPQTAHQEMQPPDALQGATSASMDLILPSLQIPASINNSGGSLAEFAAQITCLFWFESTEILNKAERLSSSSPPVKRFRDEAIPTSGFRKWVVTILSTTQVTQNVILLALLFIYRLKTINPAVKGKIGSEYRLLTVALMLGNKFLDDNTYTNKTWAEVSGISVTEIHVMEVEFLSNMRYSLLASEEQWKEWQDKLAKFWMYCDTAARESILQPSQTSSSLRDPALPSPPSSMQSSPPSRLDAFSSAATLYTQNWTPSHAACLLSPLPHIDGQDSRAIVRKRSFEHDIDGPPAKRVTRSSQAHMAAPFTSTMPPMRQDAPRLPVPNLTISTSQPYNNGPNGLSYLQHQPPLLPPLSGRAMSSVYPSTPTWTSQLPMLTPIGPQSQHGPPSANRNGYMTPSRRHSPHSVHDLLSLGSSPTSANFPHNHNSPSFYLQQRASPYKPVRYVNTLLNPPPSGSLHDYVRKVNQMHYQPLGKRNDCRPGVAYSPYQWPVLPQPNFHQ